jgi:hypothetical protein
MVDHPVAGPVVDRTKPDFGRQAGEVGQSLVDQENTRLAEENLLAKPSQMMGVARGGIGLCRAARAIYEMHNQNLHSSSKKSPRGLAVTSRASPLEWLSRAWA